MHSQSLPELLGTIHQWPVDHAAGALLRHDSEYTTGDVHHSFALASVSKLLVAYTVMIAIEEGACDLHSTLEDIRRQSIADGADQSLAPIPGQQQASIADFLAHTSGIAFDSYEQQSPVHSRRIYSSAGYDILATCIEYSTGISFTDYLDAALLVPLGMSDTTQAGSVGDGITSTLADLMAFSRELLAPTLLSEQAHSLMRTSYMPELNGIVPGYGMQKPCPWGLGFEIHGQKHPHWLPSTMPDDIVGHFGQSGTYLWYDPPGGTVAIILTDHPFGQWSKELWPEFNAQLWDQTH